MSSANPQAVVNNLQGHQVVLQQELAEINNDIATLQGMHARYSSQNGIYFDSAMHNLIALRCEKEALFHSINSQVGALSDTIQQTQILAQNLSRTLNGVEGMMGAGAGGYGMSAINTTFNNPNASTMHTNNTALGLGGGGRGANNATTTTAASTYVPRPLVTNASACVHCPLHGSLAGNLSAISPNVTLVSGFGGGMTGATSVVNGGGGAVNINTPGGLVVTTNSSILANSPRRVYRQ